jgi:zeaxanthin glucosyltransferase
MKIGFICPNIPGHLNPMTALARHLQSRNHEVVFLYSPSANGLPCVPDEKDDDMNANRPEMSKLEGDGAVAFYCGVAAKKTEMILKSLLKMVGDNRHRSSHTRSNPILCAQEMDFRQKHGWGRRN